MDLKNNPLYEKAKKIAGEKGNIDPEKYANNLEELIEEHKIFEIELEYQNLELRRIQSDLEVTLEKFKTLYNDNPAGFFTIDSNLKIVNANDTLATLVKTSKHNLYDSKITQYIASESQDDFYFFLKSLKNNDEVKADVKLTFIDSAEEKVFVIVNGKKILDQPDNIFCSVVNIDNQHHAETKLRESQKMWVTTFDAINYGVAVVKDDYTVIQTNSALCSMFGKSMDDILGQKFYKLLHNSDYTDNCIICNGIKKGRNSIIEIYEENLMKFIEVSVDPILEFGENFNCSVVIVKDISERKNFEFSLEQSEKKYKAIFENYHTVMLVLDPIDGRIISANPAAVDFYGYSRDELETKRIAEINLLTEELLKAEIEKAKKNHKNFWHFKHKLANGILKDVEVFSGPIFIEGKQYLYSIIHDITEKAELDNKLLQTNDELFAAKLKAEESDKLKSAFLANMSHEIRTPLNGILGFAELLNHDRINDQQRKNYAGIILNSGNRLLEIINDVLDLSKIESGNIVLKTEAIDLIAFFNEIFLIYAERQSPDLRFELSKPSDTQIKCLTDKTRLYQIVINLLSNAFKFTDKGKVSLSYSIDNGFLKIEVSDTGIGIDKDCHELVFKRFQQVENKTNAIKGTGLGLAIVKSLCELFGGSITLKSELFKGSQFTVVLPMNCKRESIDNITFIDEEPDYNSLSSLKGKVIVAEDEEINRDFFTSVLKKSKIEFYLAKNGVEALELANKHRDVDLILMDIKMPILNGIEATKRILAMIPDMKIVAHSAYVQREDIEKNEEAGCIDFMPKPFRVNTLIDMLKKYLR